MSSRVVGSEVKEIIDTELTDDQVEPFIQAATLLVDSYLSNKTDLSTAMLKEIERWLAAHFIASSVDPREQVVRVGTIEVNLEGTTGQGLFFSRYGQQAMLLDVTGTLKRLNQPKAVFSVQGESS